ncbi:hypothetical protein B0G75_14211 [Paraburkholderia sp. BL18I3N2]|nr:hypothetical protein B0G75_14211 [Paraburkholderia sp. BL18I3N2]
MVKGRLQGSSQVTMVREGQRSPPSSREIDSRLGECRAHGLSPRLRSEEARPGRLAKRNYEIPAIAPLGAPTFPGSGINNNLAGMAKKLGITVWWVALRCSRP